MRLEGRQFIHLKTGGKYTLLRFVLIEVDLAVAVVYRQDASGLVFERTATEFFDGRFVIDLPKKRKKR